MYKVFFKDRIVFFSDSDRNSPKDDGKIWVCNSQERVKEALDAFLADSDIRELHYVSPDISSLKTRFQELTLPITAAGGIILNEKEEILFIRRNELWDLPKGKLDQGESPEDCAYREVKEETGIKSLNVLYPGEITYHIYLLNGKLILKDTHWFIMQAPDNQNFTPQFKENITRVEWMDRNAYEKVRNETFPLIWDLVNNFKLHP